MNRWPTEPVHPRTPLVEHGSAFYSSNMPIVILTALSLWEIRSHLVTLFAFSVMFRATSGQA
jgi:hypothetical protein